MNRMSRRDFVAGSLFSAAAASLRPAEAAARTEYPSYLGLVRSGALEDREKKLALLYDECSLCPRDCRVNRNKGETGKCRASATARIASLHPHYGEEPALVGQGGSGTIFFANCNLRCVYCQNFEISIEGTGTDVTDEALARAMLKLQELGCHNINLVTPTHYLPNIVHAVRLAVPGGLRLPLVYNTSGYEKPDILALLDGIVDIYLPDFKYWDPANAAKYSSEAYSYPHYARLALEEMFRQVGDLALDGRGIARRGIILRHLVLPNDLAGTKDVLRFVAESLSKTTCVNIMRQYRPEHRAVEFKELSRQITTAEYDRAVDWARRFGLDRLAR